jgi:hypothetical protein
MGRSRFRILRLIVLGLVGLELVTLGTVVLGLVVLRMVVLGMVVLGTVVLGMVVLHRTGTITMQIFHGASSQAQCMCHEFWCRLWLSQTGLAYSVKAETEP